MKERNLKKACILYQDDDIGLEIMRGAEAGLKTIDMALAEKTSYKRGATDFSSKVAKMKAAGCELVVLGTIVRETVGTIPSSISSQDHAGKDEPSQPNSLSKNQ